MKNSFFIKKYKHIHFVGIGGIGMSALAKLCFANGIFVSGSDRTKTDITEQLEHIGIQIYYGHSKKNVKNADLLVYTCAVSKNNPELVFAKQKNIKILERADFLGEISQNFKNVIAIAGSHGKTTTSAMLSSIFISAKKDPTVIVGGEVIGLGNLRIGKNDFLIVEACEYMSHFLKIKRTTAVILNVEYDHPDFFKSKKQYIGAFEEFSKNSDNLIVSEKIKMFFQNSSLTFGTFGDFDAQNLRFIKGKTTFDVYKKQQFFVHITLKNFATFNIQNALCAIAVADLYNISPEDIALGLLNYEGVKRRYEYMGKINDNLIITDYAHHPTQIKDCILSTKMTYKRPVVAVFEPHTYSRTKTLFNDFVSALSLADHVIILPTYSAREKKISGGHAKDLFKALNFCKQNVYYCSNYKTCKNLLGTFNGATILLLGAGSIINLANDIKKEYINNQM